MYLALETYTTTVGNPYYPGPGDMNPTMSQDVTQVYKFKTVQELQAFLKNREHSDRIEIYEAKELKASRNVTVEIKIV